MKKERDSEHYRSDPRWFLAPGQVPKVTFGFVLRECYLQALPAPFTATLHSGHDRGRKHHLPEDGVCADNTIQLVNV